MKLTSIVFRFLALLLSTVHVTGVYAAEVSTGANSKSSKIIQLLANSRDNFYKDSSPVYKLLDLNGFDKYKLMTAILIKGSWNRHDNFVMRTSQVPSYLQKIGTSLFDNNLPIFLDKRSIKRVSDNSYVYTTFIGIDSHQSETDYIVNCNDISNVRLLRSRIYNKNEEITNIEQVDKLVSADFQRAGNSDRYNANQIICSQ